MRATVIAWARAHLQAPHHTLYTTGAAAAVAGAAGLAAQHAGPFAALVAAGAATIAATVAHPRLFAYVPDTTDDAEPGPFYDQEADE